MDELSLPDPELGDDPVLADDVADVVTPDEVSEFSLDDLDGPDDLNDQDEMLDPADLGYSGAAENNPESWQDDPLVNEEPLMDTPGALSDQTLRDESAEDRYEDGSEQIPPEEPTIGEAASDIDFTDPTTEDDEDASDDSAHGGGEPLADFDAEDREL